MQIAPKKLLNKLVFNNVLTQDLADRFEVESIQKNIPVYDYLLSNPEISKAEIVRAAGQVENVSYVDLENSPVDPQAISQLPESIAKNLNALPYKLDPKTDILYVATDDPINSRNSEFIEKKTGKRVILALADKNIIKSYIESSYSKGLSPEVTEALKEYKTPQEKKPIEDIGSVIKEAPIAKIVSTVLEFAIKSRASDIHIEPEEFKTRIRYRIDGILQEKLVLPKTIHDALISRIKILAEMKIDERRIPQDGRFNFKLGAEEVDLRVSTLPTVHGEKIVMRLLKKTGGIPALTELGLRGPQYKELEEAVTKPYGIVLVTGPTGSGKTTTLYSILSRLNKPTVNIITLEDPVEYEIPGINQVQINPKAGLMFANGLRSFLRQDPNIILVGEIRDKETTALAIQAALTGHLVLSTLHTNDASTAIPRLIDLGGEPFLIASVLNAALAQRIVRRVCEHCKEEFIPEQSIQDNIRTVLGDLLPKQFRNQEQIKLYKGRGNCQECGDTGYYGRIGIFEVLRVSPAINKLVLQEATSKDIYNQAVGEGLINMIQDGYLKALAGITTLEEVLRVAEI